MYAHILKLCRSTNYQPQCTNTHIFKQQSSSSIKNTPHESITSTSTVKKILSHYYWTGHIDTSVCILSNKLNISHTIQRTPGDDAGRDVYQYDESNWGVVQRVAYNYRYFKDSDNLVAFKLMINILNMMKQPIDYRELYGYSCFHNQSQIQKYLYNLSQNEKVWNFGTFMIDIHMRWRNPNMLNSTFNFACENGNLELAKQLYYNYPDISSSGNDRPLIINDQTLDNCIQNGHNDIVNWLIKIYKA